MHKIENPLRRAVRIRYEMDENIAEFATVIWDVSSKVLFGERHADIVREIVLYLYGRSYRKKNYCLERMLDFSRFNNVVAEQKCSAKGRTRGRRLDARFS